jgi:hypothetical protein
MFLSTAAARSLRIQIQRGAARREGHVFLSAAAAHSLPPSLLPFYLSAPPCRSPFLLCLVNGSARPSGASLIMVTAAARGPVLSSCSGGAPLPLISLSTGGDLGAP